jgi:sarcosine oxidase subunit gamma
MTLLERDSMVDPDTMTALGRAAAPFAGFACAGATLEAEPLLGVGKVQLLDDIPATLFEMVFEQAPPGPGGSFVSNGLGISWLAPGEWLLTGPEQALQAVIERVEAVVGDLGLVTDRSDASASFLLSGAEARDVLAAVTPLDIADMAIGVGDVARAPLGETGMFVARLPDRNGQPCFRIIVDQTLAAYAVRMLAGPKPTSGVQRAL